MIGKPNNVLQMALEIKRICQSSYLPKMFSFSNLQDTVHDVQAALARLRTEERSALLLHYMEDFPVAKVAAIMHMPAGTVKSHLKRGRDKLETFLKQNGYEKE